MGRWEPDAGGRFRAAAMALFIEKGYAQTTIADIAERAGLTRRTFFRHFADKREVLFDGSARLQDLMVDAVGGAPPDAHTLDLVAAALNAAAGFFPDEKREFARQRQAVIAANADLHERELIKLATLSSALAAALHDRGVADLDASLAGEAGIAVFRVAFGVWIGESETRSFAGIVADSLARFKALATLAPGAAPGSP